MTVMSRKLLIGPVYDAYVLVDMTSLAGCPSGVPCPKIHCHNLRLWIVWTAVLWHFWHFHQEGHTQILKLTAKITAKRKLHFGSYCEIPFLKIDMIYCLDEEKNKINLVPKLFHPLIFHPSFLSLHLFSQHQHLSSTIYKLKTLLLTRCQVIYIYNTMFVAFC